MAFLRVYKSFIVPIFDYCDAVWNCCGKGNSDSLEKLERGAARIIMKTPSSDEALEYLRYELLQNSRDKHVLKLVKKCIDGRRPQFLQNYFTYNRDIIKRTTRQSNHLHFAWC